MKIYNSSWHSLVALRLVIRVMQKPQKKPHPKKDSSIFRIFFNFNFQNYCSQKSHWNSGEHLLLKGWLLKIFRRLRWKQAFSKELLTAQMLLKTQEWDLRDLCVLTPNIVLLGKNPQFINFLKFQHTFRYIINKSIILIQFFNFVEFLPEVLESSFIMLHVSFS